MSGSPLFLLLSEFSIARYEASNTVEVRAGGTTSAPRRSAPCSKRTGSSKAVLDK